MKFPRRLKPIERYIVRAKHEWGFFYVDEQTGVFSAYTSFGTYAYCWNHRGVETLKEFLRDLDFDYFMGKTRGRKHLKFDPDKTIKVILRDILDNRRQGAIDKDHARLLWNVARGLAGFEDERDFLADLDDSPALNDFYSGYFGELFRESPDRSSQSFWNVLWPEFLKQIEQKEQRSWRHPWRTLKRGWERWTRQAASRSTRAA